MQGYLILALAILFNATANVLIKVSMSRISASGGVSVLVAALSQPAFWMGLISFGLALAAYSLVLARLNLSIAYPIMVSMGLVIVVLISGFYLNESISIMQILGFSLIVTGVWLVAR
jgi:multidrug transporter EmrE-like cation transporter